MRYKNGRVAKNGDKVILFSGAAPAVGILYDAVEASGDCCNGRIALTTPNDPIPNLKECLHVDDVRTALEEVAQYYVPPVKKSP